MVPGVGFEPTWPCGRGILSLADPARSPVPHSAVRCSKCHGRPSGGDAAGILHSACLTVSVAMNLAEPPNAKHSLHALCTSGLVEQPASSNTSRLTLTVPPEAEYHALGPAVEPVR